jgi:hypothetical protein
MSRPPSDDQNRSTQRPPSHFDDPERDQERGGNWGRTGIWIEQERDGNNHPPSKWRKTTDVNKQDICFRIDINSHDDKPTNSHKRTMGTHSND